MAGGSLVSLFTSWPLLRCTLIMYCTVLYCTVLYCTVLHCTDCVLLRYYLWFTNNLVYYGFTLNAGKLFPGDLHINMLIRWGSVTGYSGDME